MDTIWDLAPHTAAKHIIIRKDLGAWFPKLASTHNRLVFIDGFAGPGKYSKGEPGSPLIALDAAISHKHDLSGTELIFLFVEQDKERYQHLDATITSIEKPTHVQVEAIQGEFIDAVDQLIRELDGKPMAPALIMVDPFGVKGVGFETIKKLAAYPRSELLISFMYEPVTRHLKSAEFEKHLDDFFGSPDWRDAIPLDAPSRKEFLLNLAVSQLKVAGLPYVRAFEMRDEGNRTEYFLLFGTHHPEGLKVMKEAMWAVDPLGGFLFSDFTRPSQPTLFAPEPDYAQLKALVLAKFKGTTTTIDAVESFVVVETPFITKHLRKPILWPLEDSGAIQVSNRKMRHTYPSGTVIIFG